MMSTVNWKLKEHRQLLGHGVKHNLLMDLISNNYKKKAYDIWEKMPKIYAEQENCYFSEDTPGSFLREIFVEGIYNVPGFTPSRGDTVVDVGANYGDSAVWWSTKYGARVYAFEPLEEVFDVLVKNIKLNSANVKAYQMALGSGKEIRGNSNGSMLSYAGDDGEVKFQSAKLDDFKFNSMKILKIDVEGFEMEVLKGSEESIKLHLPKIILETHSSSLYSRCNKFLSELGYKIKEYGPVSKNSGTWMDVVSNLFYSYA